MPPLCLYAPGAVLTAEGADGLPRETAGLGGCPSRCRPCGAWSWPRRPAAWVVPSRWTCSPPPTTRSCPASSRVIRSRSRRARMPWPNRTGAGLVAAAGACTATVSSLSASRDLAGVRGEGALGRHAWVRRRSVHAIEPDMASPRAASLTSVDGQRDLCSVLSDTAAYVREGDDLGGAQRLAVTSSGSQSTLAGGASLRPWGSRSRVVGTQSAGRCSHSRASWTQRTVRAPQRRSRGSTSRGAGAIARGKTGASEGRLHNVVTLVLTRYARSHHIGWHCNVCWGGFDL